MRNSARRRCFSVHRVQPGSGLFCRAADGAGATASSAAGALGGASPAGWAAVRRRSSPGRVGSWPSMICVDLRLNRWSRSASARRPSCPACRGSQSDRSIARLVRGIDDLAHFLVDATRRFIGHLLVLGDRTAEKHFILFFGVGQRTQCVGKAPLASPCCARWRWRARCHWTHRW